MSKVNRRQFFQNSVLTVIGSSFALNALAKGDACDIVEKQKGKVPVSDVYVEENNLGYANVSPANKVKIGKICSNCKHFCEEKEVCTLATMLKSKKDKDKKFRKVKPGGYCNMFAWDKDKEKAWKASNKKA